MSRKDEQILGKFEPGGIADAGELGRGLSMRYEEAATLRGPSAVHRYYGGSGPASPARVLAKGVRRITATKANNR